jgi:Neprosin
MRYRLYLQVGGEVYDEWPNNNHTTTQMGSGIPPTSASGHGYEYAAYHRNVTYIDSSINYHNASLQYIVTPSGDLDEGIPGICGYEAGLFYTLSSSIAAGASGWGTYFYYGGGAGSY